MKISEIMNKVIVVESNIKVKEAAKIMSSKNIGCLLVIKDNKIAGMLTERDIMKNAGSMNKKIFDVMSKKVITIEEYDSLEHASLLMTQNKIKKLPVVDRKGKLVGIITATDIIANVEDLNEEFFFD